MRQITNAGKLRIGQLHALLHTFYAQCNLIDPRSEAAGGSFGACDFRHLIARLVPRYYGRRNCAGNPVQEASAERPRIASRSGPVSPWTAGVNIGTIETAIAPPAIERTNRERGVPRADRGSAIMPWQLRVVGLLIAATLACAAAPTARAEPRPADGCRRATIRVIIDVGHTAQAPGAISARGVPEFVFNLNLAKHIEQQLLAAGFRRSVL